MGELRLSAKGNSARRARCCRLLKARSPARRDLAGLYALYSAGERVDALRRFRCGLCMRRFNASRTRRIFSRQSIKRACAFEPCFAGREGIFWRRAIIYPRLMRADGLFEDRRGFTRRCGFSAQLPFHAGNFSAQNGLIRISVQRCAGCERWGNGWCRLRWYSFGRLGGGWCWRIGKRFCYGFGRDIALVIIIVIHHLIGLAATHGQPKANQA